MTHTNFQELWEAIALALRDQLKFWGQYSGQGHEQQSIFNSWHFSIGVDLNQSKKPMQKKTYPLMCVVAFLQFLIIA